MLLFLFITAILLLWSAMLGLLLRAALCPRRPRPHLCPVTLPADGAPEMQLRRALKRLAPRDTLLLRVEDAAADAPPLRCLLAALARKNPSVMVQKVLSDDRNEI